MNYFDVLLISGLILIIIGIYYRKRNFGKVVLITGIIMTVIILVFLPDAKQGFIDGWNSRK